VILINSVIGGGIAIRRCELITKRAVDLGFASSLGIIHDGNGSMKPLNRREARVYQEIKTYGKHSLQPHYWFQEKSCARQSERLAMPRGRSLSLHLRGMAWCTTAPSNADIPAFHSKSTPSPT